MDRAHAQECEGNRGKQRYEDDANRVPQRPRDIVARHDSSSFTRACTAA